MKDLELLVNLDCEALGLAPRATIIGPEIVHGIEINPLAAELARTTIWIGDIQWRRHNGIYSESPPILRKLELIQTQGCAVNREKRRNVRRSALACRRFYCRQSTISWIKVFSKRTPGTQRQARSKGAWGTNILINCMRYLLAAYRIQRIYAPIGSSKQQATCRTVALLDLSPQNQLRKARITLF